MKKIIFFLLLGAFLIISCKSETKTEVVVPEIVNDSRAFNEMLADFYERSLQLNPIKATFTGDKRYNASFPNFLSEAYKDSSIAFYKNYKRRLNNFDDKALSDVEKMSKAVLLWDCNINLEALKFKTDLMPIDQMWSLNLVVGQLASGKSAQPFETVQDYENWLLRLEGYTQWLHTAKAKMKEGVDIRYVLPNALITKVIPQLKTMTNKNLEEHLFYSPVKNFPKTFTEAERNALTASYTRMIEDKIIPAYDSLYNYMTSDYLKSGRVSSGIDAIPGGKEYYDFAIKKYTTTDLTAEEIHQIGLKEVARILVEMEQVKSQVKFEGELMEFFDFVRENKKLMPYTKPQQVIDNFNEIHDKMQPQLDKLFNKKPKSKFVVKRTEAFREASASAQYNAGSLDGERPGTFYVPIPDAKTYNVFSDEALFLHEAIPGHHYQISLTQENENLPQFRKTLWYSAYGEGWALYTESLGKELGLYKDPYQYFGMLGMEMHRAIRLVVDTGMHAKGWTREEAIQYSLENEAESEASIIAEIERYMANPGQALAYKVGQLKIIELRNKAESILGEKFDIREFHDQVLETGSVPLALLEIKIDNWIAWHE
ncbi:MAG: DUF885 domain-containing protein [Flavobacteriaceae bacterium]|nr:DUF885 domain-containing protein [Flavobacteriaceae bacterium]